MRNTRPTRMRSWLFVAVLTVLIPSASAQTARIAFEKNDTLEEIRQKIEANGYAFQVEPNWVYKLPESDRQRLLSRRASPKPLKPLDEPDYGPLMQVLSRQNGLPSSFDWRSQGGHTYIGAVRNQGDCGSCYSFGATAALESVYNINNGLYDGNCVDLSEAFLAFCLGELPAYYDHFYGCDGADYDYLELQALAEYGLPLESAFPYSDSLTACQQDSWNASRYSVQSWHRVPCADVNAIKTAIYNYGVVDAAVLAGDAFMAYSTGVYDDTNASCDTTPCYYAETNHAIALVGWNDDPVDGGYWILRNSWGTSWGESGYMRIKYQAAHVSCAVC
ncbi:MAG TPA: C1 family peptidase, partial [bacterium]|nr:C1 family peptidase [bacterium]